MVFNPDISNTANRRVALILKWKANKYKCRPGSVSEPGHFSKLLIATSLNSHPAHLHTGLNLTYFTASTKACSWSFKVEKVNPCAVAQSLMSIFTSGKG